MLLCWCVALQSEMERTNVFKRISLVVLNFCGARIRTMFLGYMLFTLLASQIIPDVIIALLVICMIEKTVQGISERVVTAELGRLRELKLLHAKQAAALASGTASPATDAGKEKLLGQLADRVHAVEKAKVC